MWSECVWFQLLFTVYFLYFVDVSSKIDVENIFTPFLVIFAAFKHIFLTYILFIFSKNDSSKMFVLMSSMKIIFSYNKNADKAYSSRGNISKPWVTV